jgi:hypothetical protein
MTKLRLIAFLCAISSLSVAALADPQFYLKRGSPGLPGAPIANRSPAFTSSPITSGKAAPPLTHLESPRIAAPSPPGAS